MINLPVVNDGCRGDEVELTCPCCGYQYLHHGRVEVFDRSEDQELVSKTTIDDDGEVIVSRIPNKGSGNPSGRRHGLRIFFECEHGCKPVKVLNIAQHKGVTELYWTTYMQEEGS